MQKSQRFETSVLTCISSGVVLPVGQPILCGNCDRELHAEEQELKKCKAGASARREEIVLQKISVLYK